MTSDADRDVGWQRRYRQTDLGAALFFGAAVPAAFRLGSAAMACMVIAGIILTLTYRERRIERVGRELWMTENWWLFRPLRVRRQSVQPGRVVLTVPEGGWLSRERTVLYVDGQEGPIVLERWWRPSERMYAMQLATDLARWFGVRVSGVLAPFDNRPDAPARWAALRASLDVLAGVPSRLTMGALLASYGLAGALPGRIRAEIFPAGLHVERLGLRSDVHLHVPFTNVTWLGAPSTQRKQPTLQIGCGDAFANLTAHGLGLKPDLFEWFCGVYRRALADWLDRHLDQRASAAIHEEPPAPPTGPLELDDRRAAPTVPRLSAVLVGAFIVALFLVARGPAYPVTHMLAQVFGLNALLAVAGFAVVFAALVIAGSLFLSAP